MSTGSTSGANVVRVRRAPKYGVFALLGAALGIVAALVLTYAFHGTEDPSRYTDIVYSQSQAFGLIVLWCLPIGIAVGLGVALLLERLVGRRTRQVVARHETVEDA